MASRRSEATEAWQRHAAGIPSDNNAASGPLSLVLLVLVAIAPLVPLLVHILARPWPPTVVDDDAAAIEMQVRNASHGRQLVGPYSRFGWNHPGPLEAYSLVPFYVVSSRRTQGLFLGSLLLNMAAAAGIVLLARRAGGGTGAALSAFLLCLLAIHVGPSRLASPWNPFITILPFTLVVFLCIDLAAVGWALLPVLGAVASFVVQTHIAYAPSLALLFAAAVALRWRFGRDGGAPHAGRLPGPRTAALALGTALVLWLPPLVELARESPGNLTRIVRFFGSRAHSHTFVEILDPLVQELGGLPLALAGLLVPKTSDARHLGAGFVTLVLLGLLPLALSAALRGRSPALIASSVLAVVAVLAMFLSVNQIVDKILDYLVLWTSAVGLVVLFAVGVVALGRAAGRVTARAVTGAAVLVAVLAAARMARLVKTKPPMPIGTIQRVAAVSREVGEYLRTHRIARPLFSIGSHDTWVPASGIFLELDRAGLDFAVEDSWLFMFGAGRRARGTEDKTLVFAEEDLSATLRNRPDYALISQNAGLFVHAVEDPTYLARHLVKEGVEVVAASRTRGAARLASGGRLPPEGLVWDSPRCIVLEDTASSVTVRVPPLDIAGILVSADHNDTYVVSASRDGQSFEPVGRIRPVAGGGMMNRVLFTDALAGARLLRISPESGDGAYSIAAVRFLSRTPQ